MKLGVSKIEEDGAEHTMKVFPQKNNGRRDKLKEDYGVTEHAKSFVVLEILSMPVSYAPTCEKRATHTEAFTKLKDRDRVEIADLYICLSRVPQGLKICDACTREISIIISHRESKSD